MIQTALDQMSASRPVYQLHGSTFASEMSYGSLSVLLARLDISPGASWHHTTKVLGEFLSPDGVEPAVVILSQTQLMDRDSVTVLAQLAQQRRVTLVVQCDRQLDLPSDFAALARAGSLQRIAVQPLTPAAARELLSGELGGPISRMATTVLWRYSAGHPGQLSEVAELCIESGKLRRVDGTWVMGSGPMPHGEGPGGHDIVLRRLPARRRALLEVLAARGPVQVSELIRAGDGAELDQLQSQGIVQIRSTPDGRVAVVQPMWRDRVLGALEPERQRELDALVQDRDTGLGHRLRLAEEHLATADAAGALALLAPELSGSGAAEATSDVDMPASVRARLAWAKVRALMASSDLSTALDTAEWSPDTDEHSLTVLLAVAASARGDLPAARRWLDVNEAFHRADLLDPQHPGLNGEAVRLRAEATRAEVLAFSDDQDGARRAATWVDHELAMFHRRGVLDDIMSSYDRAALAVSLLETRLKCGDLEACRHLAEAILTCRHGNPQAVLFAELVVVALELLSGQFEQAEDRASRLAVQGEAVGDRHATAVAQALAAYCRSTYDRADPQPGPDAAGADARATDVGPVVWGRLGWFTEVIRSLTVAADGAGDAAVARLAALADRARGEGLFVVELHALLGAVLLGSSDLAPRLQDVAARTQAAVSPPSAELAAAILADDTAMFCTALTRLASGGYTGWCHGGITPVVARLPPAEARRLAEAMAVQQDAGMERAPDAAPVWMEALTPREREIAQMVVEGLSNATVARRNGISVRTVEGHLYQIYAKLQVRGRDGLTRLAAQSAQLQAIE
ncbi:response regulator transcription factor [Raineyella antarctica]|uniref:response regulator transcription factor n=1 Tax=Raineyella antarctica TaxID=1577474 RepID=UPI001587FB94|nr:helix-turn-helix transcriptional regulator [Raineyella antarctica]